MYRVSQRKWWLFEGSVQINFRMHWTQKFLRGSWRTCNKGIKLRKKKTLDPYLQWPSFKERRLIGATADRRRHLRCQAVCLNHAMVADDDTAHGHPEGALHSPSTCPCTVCSSATTAQAYRLPSHVPCSVGCYANQTPFFRRRPRR